MPKIIIMEPGTVFDKITLTSLVNPEEFKKKQIWLYSCNSCGKNGTAKRQSIISRGITPLCCYAKKKQPNYNIRPGLMISERIRLEEIHANFIRISGRKWGYTCIRCGSKGFLQESTISVNLSGKRRINPRCCDLNGKVYALNPKEQETIQRKEFVDVPLFRPGAQVGLLRIIKMVRADMNPGNRIYLADCSCGRLIEVLEIDLTTYEKKHCGCMKKLCQSAQENPFARSNFPPGWGQRKPLNEVML